MFEKVFKKLFKLKERVKRLEMDIATLKGQMDTLKADVEAFKTSQAATIADLQAQIAAGNPVTNDQLQALSDEITGLDAEVKPPTV